MPKYPSLTAFIVHGHDHQFRDAVKSHLTKTLGFKEAVVLDATASAGLTVIEKFERESKRCDVAIVLLTPDDEARTREGLPYKTARPNVWFELGYFIGFLGRKTGRVILLFKKGLDMPSDLAGVIYIDATEGFRNKELRQKIEVELNSILQRPVANLALEPLPAAILSTELRLEGTVRLLQ